MVLSMDRWVGKVAVVTGASAGIGAAIAEHLVNAGVKVVGLARRKERVDALAKKLAGKKGQLYGVKADMTNEGDIMRAFKWTKDNVGPVHILINNAGLGQATNLIDGETQKWKLVLDTNVLGLCIATREAIKQMQANKIDGHIIHINSLAGHRVPPIPGMNVYPASKYAVTALTETLRQELNRANSKIKITSLSPGAVKTEITKSMSTKPTNSQIDPKFLQALKMMTYLDPEDIADSCLYALSTPPHVQIHELTVRTVEELLHI